MAAAGGHHGNACTIHMLNHQHQVHYLSVPLVLIIMLPLIPRDLHTYGSAEALHYIVKSRRDMIIARDSNEQQCCTVYITLYRVMKGADDVEICLICHHHHE